MIIPSWKFQLLKGNITDLFTKVVQVEIRKALNQKNLRKNTMSVKKPLLVRDVVHGDMYFDHPIELVIDHKLFQRLKFIVQNGICYQVFPGMTHTRFQHSLGVCHLSQLWFNNLIDKDDVKNLLNEMRDQSKNIGIPDGYEISLFDTYNCYNEIKNNQKKWQLLLAIAALCHDLGHGPFSHLLEEANFVPSKKLLLDCKSTFPGKISQSLQAYLSDKYKNTNTKVDHEDITLIYLSVIFFDLQREDSFFKPKENLHFVSCLISKDFKKFFTSSKHKKDLNEQDVKAINLLSCLTSGFVDVDRLDYLVRDSKMAGVEIGSVEIKKITNSLIPCLFKKDELFVGGFLAQYKNHHIIDNFFFSLYQVYTTVIYHPRALQMNFELTLLLNSYSDYLKKYSAFNYLEWHKDENDLSFIQRLKSDKFDPNLNKVIDKIVTRDKSYHSKQGRKSIYAFPTQATLPNKLKEEGFKSLDAHKREMLKDGAFIWLFVKSADDFTYYNWENCSVVSQKLKGHSFKPNVYWKNDELQNDIEKIYTKTASLKISRSKINTP